ncbi:MAG TPA: 3-oxoacyl-ACP reductase FabG [Candidatus Binataceae bacterium]|nr:3-oxoacyl-ACP reductase FabG [Candidatus Binataceae bacterium]
MRFDAKCALVTGGASGIGRAACLAFAREGADVAVADMNLQGAESTAREVISIGRRAVAVAVDVADPASATRMIEAAVGGLGQLDILNNCAGVRELIPFLDLKFEDWQRVISINLTGTFLCSQAFARYLVGAGRPGKIVNMSSAAGLVAAPHRAAYVSSKHGVIGLTKEMALELARNNIQVNAVAPGVTETPMTQNFFRTESGPAVVRKLHPAGRWAQPEEIAQMILFLASGAADFVTGATFSIDGGFVAGRSFES